MEKENSNSSFKKILLLVSVLAALFIALTCFYQIRITESAVLTTFEKPVRTVTKPGLHFKMPWPVQKAYMFDKRMRVYQSPYMEFLVKDGFNIVVRVFACWSIEDVGIYKNKVGVTTSRGEQLLSTLVSKNLKSVMSENSLSDLIGANNLKSSSGKDASALKTQPGAGSFSSVENEILQSISKEAFSEYGIKVSAVGFDRLELPEDTTEDVFNRMKSERMRMVEKIQSEGKSRAMTIKKEADLNKNKILAEAEAGAVKIRGEADTKAFEYLDVYNKDPQFAQFLKKLQALENTVKTKTTIVIDKNTPPFDMLSPDTAGKIMQDKSSGEKK